MKRVQIAAILGLVLLATLVIYLALRNPQPPLLPPDADHGRFVSSGACLSCHGPEGESPQSPTHPVRNDCMNCHGRR